MRRVPLVLAVAMTCASFAPFRGATAPRVSEPALSCGATLYGNVTAQLAAIEHDADTSLAAVTRRSAVLVRLTGPQADLFHAIARPCRSETGARLLGDVARVDALVTWSRMLALRATESPIYPKPYRRACYLYDLSGVQDAFIEAWVDRDSPRATAFSREAVWMALGREPLFAHVATLASETAHRIGVRDLPTIDSDETWWLAANRKRHHALATELEPGVTCGPTVALYGLPPVERAGGVRTASTRP